MKIPKTFRTEKDLEKKIKQLLKGSKKISNNELFTVSDLIDVAKAIAQFGSRKDKNQHVGDLRVIYHSKCDYSDYGISLSYAWGYDKINDKKTWDSLEIISKGKVVLKTNKDIIEHYSILGNWEKEIFNIYEDETAEIV